MLLLPAAPCVSFVTSQSVSPSGRQQSGRRCPSLPQVSIHMLCFSVLPLVFGLQSFYLFKESVGKFEFNIRHLILSATFKDVTFLLKRGTGSLVIGEVFKKCQNVCHISVSL